MNRHYFYLYNNYHLVSYYNLAQKCIINTCLAQKAKTQNKFKGRVFHFKWNTLPTFYLSAFVPPQHVQIESFDPFVTLVTLTIFGRFIFIPPFFYNYTK